MNPMVPRNQKMKTTTTKKKKKKKDYTVETLYDAKCNEHVLIIKCRPIQFGKMNILEQNLKRKQK